MCIKKALRKTKEGEEKYSKCEKSWRKGSYVAMANLFSNSIGVYSTNQDDFHALFVIHFHAKREAHNNSRFLSFIAMKQFFLSLFSSFDAASAADVMFMDRSPFLNIHVITTICRVCLSLNIG